jgi:CubicO group peptidase (beta-lactamase class C family)
MNRALIAVLALGAGLLAATAPAHAVPAEQPIEQNSPVQAIPAPNTAAYGMLGRPVRTLRPGTPEQVGLLPGPLDQIDADMAAAMGPYAPKNKPLLPGGVVLVAHDGRIVKKQAYGYQSLYSGYDAATNTGILLPPDQQEPTRTDTIYDMASLSKLFTGLVAVKLMDQHRLDPDAYVVQYLPAFASHGKSDITVNQLLTHTSGLLPDPVPALWTLPPDQRVNGILDTTPEAPAGSEYKYSDINYMTLALVEQAITGKTLDVLVHDYITGPLHMTSTMYNPPAYLLPRIAAEEYETTPARGMVRGQVHDENAWALGGVAGHAGVFSDADDMAILAQTILNGGVYGHTRILSEHAVVEMMTNRNQAFVGQNQGYGFELYQHWYDGALATPYTLGHTGFTGTDITIDPTTNTFAMLLANGVHPTRNWGPTTAIRRTVSNDVARSIPVRPAQGRTSWFSGMNDHTTVTLTAPVTLRTDGARLDFDVWYDTEPQYDVLTLQTSRDNGTTWTTVPFTMRDGGRTYPTDGTVSGYNGHQWLPASADLPGGAGPVLVRWQYTTDNAYHGRGVYLDGIQVWDGQGTAFDDRRPSDAATLTAVGFAPSTD